MKIFSETFDKRRCMPLLLLGDEQESMIDKYLDKCDLYVMADGDIAAAVRAVTDIDGECEIRNSAVHTSYQRQGTGRQIISYIERQYSHRCKLVARTLDSPLTVPFYISCIFHETTVSKDISQKLRQPDSVRVSAVE